MSLQNNNYIYRTKILMYNGLQKFIYLLLVLIVIGSSNAVAQFSPTDEKPKKKAKPPRARVYKNPVMRKQKKASTLDQAFQFGYGQYTRGYYFTFQRWWNAPEAEKPFYHGVYIDIGIQKHLREKTVTSALQARDRKLVGNPRYTYGKINDFIPIKFGYAQKRPISGKLEPNHVLLSLVTGAGLNIGLLKPYYLNIARSTGGSNFVSIPEKYNEANAVIFTDPRYIYGKSSFSTGLSESQVIPGIHAKVGVDFEFTWNSKSTLHVEIGSMLDVYTSRVNILVSPAESNFIFPSLYANLKYGRIWAKAYKD
jgi:hypothetical protein